MLSACVRALSRRRLGGRRVLCRVWMDGGMGRRTEGLNRLLDAFSTAHTTPTKQKTQVAEIEKQAREQSQLTTLTTRTQNVHGCVWVTCLCMCRRACLRRRRQSKLHASATALHVSTHYISTNQPM